MVIQDREASSDQSGSEFDLGEINEGYDPSETEREGSKDGSQGSEGSLGEVKIFSIESRKVKFSTVSTIPNNDDDDDDDDDYYATPTFDLPSSSSSSVTSPTPHLKPYDFWSPRTRMRKLRIWKNVIVLSIGFVLMFTAFQSISNLQSTMNSDEGLGTSSLAMVYAALVFSCMFLPPVIVGFLGFKWTLVIAPLCYGSYMVANLVINFIPCGFHIGANAVEGKHFRWAAMMITASLLGLFAAPMWTAKSSYMTELGIMYSKLTGETKEAVINRFFGVFFLFFQSGQIWGNLISSEILKQEAVNNTLDNTSLSCGNEFKLPNKTSSEACSDKEVELEKVSLCSVFIGCAVASSLVFLFLLDNFRRVGEKKRGFSLSLLLVTLKNLGDPNQALFVPLTIWSGLEQGFIISDYTKAWVSCSMGMDKIGYTMIAFGLTNSICSFLFGRLVKHLGRIFFYTLAAAFNYAAILAMLFWFPSDEDHNSIYFILAAMWGISDAVWQTQINALYGVLFMKNQEAGFANYRLWESTGFIIAFIYADLISIRSKIFVLLITLSLGMIGYFLIEVRQRCFNNQNEAIENNNNNDDDDDDKEEEEEEEEEEKERF